MANTPPIPKNALIVIATGGQAKLYRNQADNGSLALSSPVTLTPKNLGQEGPSGKRPPEESEQETDEATFSKQLARSLYQKAHAGEFSDLVLIADPDTLGELRPQLHQEVRDKLVFELNKTLIHADENEIVESIAAD